MSGPARIRIHIDRLVLHGVAPGDARAVEMALRRQVAALVEAQGLAAGQSLSLPRLTAGEVTPGGHGGNAELGKAAGTAVYGALAKACGGGAGR